MGVQLSSNSWIVFPAPFANIDYCNFVIKIVADVQVGQKWMKTISRIVHAQVSYSLIKS